MSAPLRHSHSRQRHVTIIILLPRMYFACSGVFDEDDISSRRAQYCRRLAASLPLLRLTARGDATVSVRAAAIILGQLSADMRCRHAILFIISL